MLLFSWGCLRILLKIKCDKVGGVFGDSWRSFCVSRGCKCYLEIMCEQFDSLFCDAWGCLFFLSRFWVVSLVGRLVVRVFLLFPWDVGRVAGMFGDSSCFLFARRGDVCGFSHD